MPRRRVRRRRRIQAQSKLRQKQARARSEPQVSHNIRVAFGMIVFNGDFVLDAVLESIYPFASQIVIAEGPVSYFASRGITSSTDGTVNVIKTFPDPERKIQLVQGPWGEKDDMVNGYAALVREDMQFIFHIDSDEVWKAEDLRAVYEMLPNYDSVGFRSLTFYGGFDHILTGFEQGAEFHRIQRWYPGARWHTHRPPTVLSPEGRPWREHRHLSYETLANMGIYMYHYSYVWPRQVRQKTEYYHDSVAQGVCIDDYYDRVYKPWVLGDEAQRRAIEEEFDGVHDFKAERRGPCRTERFTGQHPEAIRRRLDRLRTGVREGL